MFVRISVSESSVPVIFYRNSVAMKKWREGRFIGTLLSCPDS